MFDFWRELFFLSILYFRNGEEWWRVRKRTQTPILASGAVIRFLPQLDQVVLDFMEM